MIGFHIILILPPSRRSLDGKKLYTGAGFVSVVDVVKYGYEKGVEDFFYVSGGGGCHLCCLGDYPDVSFL